MSFMLYVVQANNDGPTLTYPRLGPPASLHGLVKLSYMSFADCSLVPKSENKVVVAGSPFRKLAIFCVKYVVYARWGYIGDEKTGIEGKPGDVFQTSPPEGYGGVLFRTNR